jgi:SAM-dependent methyltransferase
MKTEKPPHQRPELPEFWEHRFRSGCIPWDAGRAPQALRDFAADFAGQPPRVLVPGCGSAWDAAFLDQRGWEVSALDFSVAALESARAALGSGWRGQLLCADFFTFPFDAPFDVIYERAFLCALPRPLWPNYAPRMAELLRPGGLLAGSFYFSDEPKGPPFGILQPQLESFLAPWFTLRADRPVEDSLPVFAGRERWQVWERKPP